MQSKPQPNQYVYFKTALPLKKNPTKVIWASGLRGPDLHF